MADDDVRREKLLEEMRHVTGKVSDLCRFIGFGLLAIFYAMTVGDTTFAKHVREGWSWWVLFPVGLSGALAILFDYIQFLCGERSVGQALDSETQKYDKTSNWYRCRATSFLLKQIATGVGVILLIVLFFIGINAPIGVPAPT